MKASTASISADLPAADEDCTSTAERLLELARDRRQVGHQLVGVLADQAAGSKVGGDPLEQLGVLKQLQRLGSLLGAAAAPWCPWARGPSLICSLLQLLELEQHLAAGPP